MSRPDHEHASARPAGPGTLVAALAVLGCLPAILVPVRGEDVDLDPEYGAYSEKPCPEWLDQSLSGDDFTIRFTDDLHHSQRFLKGADTDGDKLPDLWEELHFGPDISFSGGIDNPDDDGKANTNFAELCGGSWPNQWNFRPSDTIPSGEVKGRNLVATEVLRTLNTCLDRYAVMNLEEPADLPIEVYIRYASGGGYSGTTGMPLWVSSTRVLEMHDPDRRYIPIHELFHRVQRTYYGENVQHGKWFHEGCARMIQDVFYEDMDLDPGSSYLGSVGRFLGDPEDFASFADGKEINFFSREYENSLFWKYYIEQTGSSDPGEPWEGMDAIRRYLENTNPPKQPKGLHEQESITHDLAQLEQRHPWRGAHFDDFFKAWATSLFTRHFDYEASQIPSRDKYFYRDEQETDPNNPSQSMRARPVRIANDADGHPETEPYIPEMVPAGGTVSHVKQHVRDWRSRYYSFSFGPGVQALNVRINASANQKNFYAVVAVRNGAVQSVHDSTGDDLERLVLASAADEVGVVVAALEDGAIFNLSVDGFDSVTPVVNEVLVGHHDTVLEPGEARPQTLEIPLQILGPGRSDPRVPEALTGALDPQSVEVLIGGQAAPVLAVMPPSLFPSGPAKGDPASHHVLVCQVPMLAPGQHDLEVSVVGTSHILSQIVGIQVNASGNDESPPAVGVVVADLPGDLSAPLRRELKTGLDACALLARADNKVGLVSSGGPDDGIANDARLLRPPEEMTNANRDLLRQAIAAQIPDTPNPAWTGAWVQGVELAAQQIIAAGTPGFDRRILVISSFHGSSDQDPVPVEDFFDVLTQGEIHVDVLAVGSDARAAAALQTVARRTGGRFYHAPVSDGAGTPLPLPPLRDLLQVVQEQQNGLARIWSHAGTVAAGGRVDLDLPASSSGNSSDWFLTVHWPAEAGTAPLDVELTDAAGGTIPPLFLEPGYAMFPYRPEPTGEGDEQHLRCTSTGGACSFHAVVSGPGPVDQRVDLGGRSDPADIAREQRLAPASGVRFEWAEVGDVGNPPDPGNSQSADTYGSVPYRYRIGKHEVTNAQYGAFLNAVDPEGTNPHDLYNPRMGSDDFRGGIQMLPGNPVGSRYQIREGRERWPANYVSQHDTARFANWLHNGQGGPGSTETGAYVIVDDLWRASITRQPGALYFLPSEDEWYKAVYYAPGSAAGDDYWLYPTRSDTRPVGELPPGGTNSANFSDLRWPLQEVGSYPLTTSYYGLFDGGGNVWEWNEAVIDPWRGVRGGSYESGWDSLESTIRTGHGASPVGELADLGFRIASVLPDPLPQTGAQATAGTRIKVSVFDPGSWGITPGARAPEETRITAHITAPSGVRTVLPLRMLDRGDPGIFGAQYTRTPWPGSYRVVVVAEGVRAGSPFRSEHTAFFVVCDAPPDSDLDGMPDRWERRYGLHPLDDGDSDADRDVDGDDLSNVVEFQLGTSPVDDDSDHGGAADGSEVAHGLNPAIPHDDPIQAPNLLTTNEEPLDDYSGSYPQPEPGENLLYWGRSSSSAAVDIYRADDPAGPFLLIAGDVPVDSAPFVDRGLTNDQRYHYRLAAKTAGGVRSALSRITSGIPKEDHVRPWGDVSIEERPITLTRTVTLVLSADRDTAAMRVSNHGFSQDPAWEPFVDTKLWELDQRLGTKLVHVQFRDAAGNVSLPCTASISHQSDADGDGLGDEWERTKLNSLDFDDHDDPDGDGLSNLDEMNRWLHPGDPDTDGDGLEDGWELRFGLNPHADDSEGDPDHDASPNRDEQAAGTDPTDPDSAFRLASVRWRIADETIEVDWHSVPGKTYAIEWTASLDQPFVPIREGVPASDGTTTGTEIAPGGSRQGFLRVRVGGAGRR